MNLLEVGRVGDGEGKLFFLEYYDNFCKEDDWYFFFIYEKIDLLRVRNLFIVRYSVRREASFYSDFIGLRLGF